MDGASGMAEVGEGRGRYPWIRRVHAVGSAPQVDRFGWLVDLPWARAGVPLAGRRADKLLVVLGERGCGKSDLIIEEAAALQSEGHFVELVDLNARGRFYEAVSARRDLGAVLERVCEGDPGYVLLDSLDEGLDRLGVLDDILVGCLEELGRERRSRLRLRIACRSGRWPRGLERHLQSLWAPEAVSVVGVTPLTRSDVEMAAACDRLDGRRVTRRLEQKGAVALAWSPITLKPLLEAEREGWGLPSTVADAYRLACRQLSSHGHRDGNPLAPDHLTALASRVAAAMQFGHYAAIHDTPSAMETDVALADLESGDEPGAAGVSYHCGMRELLALVDSGLMVEIGLRRWAFVHDSYQQYLAAQFLARHHMHDAAQGQLLWMGDGTSGHVVERHREVAAWRVVDDTELFAEVLRYDPEVLLLADLTALRDQQREAVVDRLLDLVSSDDTVQLDRGMLHRLKHPGLSAQLRPHLSLPAAPPLLSTVLRIARACQLPELNDQLLTLAETQGIDPKLRRLAVQALGDELDADHVARLRALAEQSDADLGRLPVLEQDPERMALLRALAWRGDADLAAAALERLWPRHLRLPEFLDLIPPADDPTQVRSAWLLIHNVPNLLRPEDVDEAVAWATRTLGSRHPRAGLTLSGESQLSVRLPVRILAQAIALFDEDDTNNDSAQRNGRLDVVADALLTLAGRADFDDRHQLTQPVGEVLLSRPGIRRELGQRVLERGDDHQVTRLLSWSGSPALFSTDDSVYWTLQWPTLSPDARRYAEWLVTAWPDPADPDLPSALELRERYPDLKAATARWDTRTEEEAQQQREQEEQRHHRAFNEARLRLALTALSTGEGPPEPPWQHITTELYRTADGSQAPQDRLGAVAAAPSFPHERSELHRLLLDAAVTVTRRSTALSGAAATPATADRNRAATALTALALLDASHLAEAFDHQPRRAAVAAVALAAHDCHDSDDTALRHSLITQCARLAGHELPTLLHQALDGCSEQELNSLTTAFAHTAVPDGVQTLRDWANDPGRSDVQWAGVLTSLALAGDRPAQEIVSAAVTDPDIQRDAARSSSRWTRAAAALMEQPQLPEIWPAIRATLATPGVLAALLERLIAADPKGTWPSGTGQLPEAALADLYIMVTEHIGITRLLDYQFEGGFYTDARSNLHRGLLGLLISKTSPEAVRELTGLATRYPELADLRRHVKATAREVAELQAFPVVPKQLRRLAADTKLRTVTDARHLQDIVLASLDRLQTILQGSNGLVVNLWNRNNWTVDHTDWWPCWEEDFSDMVAALLRQDIGGNRVVINREVQVDRSGFPGRRTDIQIQAAAPPTSSSDGTLTVVIECKGCWHRDLSTALADQLVRDYLRTPGTAGIYLIGYFDCDRWNREMRRKRHHASENHTIRDLQQGQDARAQEQRDQYGAIVAAKVLDCRLPGANDPWRADPRTVPEPSE
ncbi:NACHT domain-containing protein [Streptomyces hayashii]|uniref:NACHT domain-containing protein n=1 Tax=Streptomyces hayashii TaxID=2839966 RepID=UPI00403D12B3